MHEWAQRLLQSQSMSWEDGYIWIAGFSFGFLFCLCALVVIVRGLHEVGVWVFTKPGARER